MSERTQEQLNNEYAVTLAQVGEKQYQMRKMQGELQSVIDSLFSKIDILQKEAGELAAKKKLEDEAAISKAEEVKEADVLPISE
jgi:hypothetical protein